MAQRGKGTGARHAPRRRLGTSEARTDFTKLVKELSSIDRPGPSLVENAIEVGPQRKGGVWLVPQVDAEAAAGRIDELQDTVASLEDELEDLAIGLLLADRLGSSAGGTTPAADVIRELGFDDLARDLPE